MKTFRVIILCIISSGLILSCEISLQKRIDSAEVSVNDAKRVNADKYAPNEIQTAIKALNEAKIALAVKKKKQAEEKVKKADEFANKAYFKSLHEFVLFQSNRTKERMDAALRSGADVLVPDKFQEAKKLADKVQEDLEKVKVLQKKLKKIEAKNKKS
jgi:hypothetical protein